MAAPTEPRNRLWVLMQQLRQDKSENAQISGDTAVKEEIAAPVAPVRCRNLDDSGKALSSTGFSASVSPLPAIPRVPLPRAVVLVCLFLGEEGDLRVILTKRSSKISTHSGEVSLPGGKAEAGDADDIATAVREAKEEIGLDPSLVSIIAVLEPFLSRVVPVIGVLSNKQAFLPVLNTAEVEAVFDAPLEMFLKDDNHKSEEREWAGKKYEVHFFHYEYNEKKFLIWGVTSGILIHAASFVYQRKPSFSKMKRNYKYYT